jgi:lysophospholipase L1-like esterase
MSFSYYDGDSVINQLDDISWSVPNVPAPFVGHVPEPGKHNNSYINSMQFRADKEIATPKPPYIYRIFLTGGSTAYGTGSPSQQRTIAGYLNKILNEQLSLSANLKYEVLTMANSAWASTHERIMIENRLSELEPDMVISLSGNNDIHWGLSGRNVFWFRSYYDELYWKIINAAYAMSGYNGIKDITEIESKSIPCSLVSERLVKNIMLSSFALSLNDITYIFFLQPNLDVTKKILTERESQYQAKRDNSYMSNEERKNYFLECFSLMNNELDKLDIDNFHYFDLSDIFDNINEKEDIFIDSYHFGDKGNEVIAKNIYKYIKDFATKKDWFSPPFKHEVQQKQKRLH